MESWLPRTHIPGREGRAAGRGEQGQGEAAAGGEGAARAAVDGEPEPLGLYEGTPLTERGEWYAGVLPDRITIYRGPTLRMCETREEVVAETEVTVMQDTPLYTSFADLQLAG